MALHSKVHLPVQFGLPTEPRSPAGSDDKFVDVLAPLSNPDLSPKWASEYTSDSTSSECRDVETYGESFFVIRRIS